MCVFLNWIPLERNVDEVVTLYQKKKRLSYGGIVIRTTDTLRRRDSSERHRNPVRKGAQYMMERVRMETSA